MEKTNQAYDHTMSVIESLKKQGIRVVVQVPRVIRESNSPGELEIVKKYDIDGRIHWSKWRNVQFFTDDQDTAKKIMFAKHYLGENGIFFDSGAGCGSIDWELDWSFSFNKQSFSSNSSIDDLMVSLFKK